MLLTLLDTVTFFVCALCAVLSLGKIVIGKFSVLHICVIAFFIMQGVPLFVEAFSGITPLLMDYPFMYDAMQDVLTGVVYDEFVLLVSVVLMFAGDYFSKARKPLSELTAQLDKLSNRPYFMTALAILSFLPVVAALFSPDQTMYLHFAPLYDDSLQISAAARSYHNSVMVPCSYIAFAATMIRYFCKKGSDESRNLSVALAIVVFSWLDGKRALLMFSLMGILAIDIIKGEYANRPGRLIAKAALFAAIAILYFQVYTFTSGKGEDIPPLMHYTMYYSRLNSVKTAIYAALNGMPMVEYWGQTFLYNFLFFVPRVLWPAKPVMFCKYFTAFSISGNCTDFVQWNMLVNFWSEAVGNFGLLGIALALVVVLGAAYLTDTTDNIFVFLFGAVFLCFYFMFGFETLTMVTGVGWALSLIYAALQRRRIKKRAALQVSGFSKA